MMENALDRLYTHWARLDDRFGETDFEGIAMMSPVILFFLIISVVPILYGIWLSFQSGTGAINLNWVGADNYVQLLQSSEFWWSVYRGVVFAGYTLVLQLILGVAIALSLNQGVKFQNAIRAVVFLPYMIPTVAVAAIFKWMLQAELGVVNWALLETGLIVERVNFFSEAIAMHSVVWASTWKWTVFVILVVLARLQTIDQTLYEAAKTNGAGLWGQFKDVTWPQIRTIILLIVLLRGIWQFSKFEMIYLLTEGGPFEATTTTTIYAYLLAFEEFDFGGAAATTTMIFVLLLSFGAVYFLLSSPEEEVEVAQ